LPGGHLNECESICDCVLREIKEETGLILNNIQFKGFSHFFNRSEQERYIVFNFYSDTFSGNLKKRCEEGELFWIRPDDVDINTLSDGMAERIDLFMNCNCSELFAEWDNNIGCIETKKQFLFMPSGLG